MQKKPLWGTHHDTAAILGDRAPALPLAQQATCREGRNIGRVWQLLVCDVELNAARDLVANALCKARKYATKSLSSVIADQGQVRGVKPGDIVRRNRQRILLQTWIARDQVPDHSAAPNECATVFHHFRAEKIGRRFREECRTTKNVAGGKP